MSRIDPSRQVVMKEAIWAGPGIFSGPQRKTTAQNVSKKAKTQKRFSALEEKSDCAPKEPGFGLPGRILDRCHSPGTRKLNWKTNKTTKHRSLDGALAQNAIHSICNLRVDFLQCRGSGMLKRRSNSARLPKA